jgi:hypothetical protein
MRKGRKEGEKEEGGRGDLGWTRNKGDENRGE